jgi:DNA segregation ATPase FtsK/SpoIIIE-like protein
LSFHVNYTNRSEAARDQSAYRSPQRNSRDSSSRHRFAINAVPCLSGVLSNDPSWNSVGQTETHNWAGSIGANVAATVFQFIGLAGYLLPLLLFAAAWRRFRTLNIQSPLSPIAGLIVLVVSVSALLPSPDASSV